MGWLERLSLRTKHKMLPTLNEAKFKTFQLRYKFIEQKHVGSLNSLL